VEAVTQQSRETCIKVSKARDAITILESPQCEVVLQRRCFDVSKVAYLLRCSGDRVNASAQHIFDARLRPGTEDAIPGPLSDERWGQTTLGVDAGGLGMREATVVALPAFIASRVASRPLVEEMCRHAEAEGIGTAQACMDVYDTRTRAAAERWGTSLPQGVHEEARRIIEAAAAAATRRWRSWCAGEEEEQEETQLPSASVSRRPGANVVPDVGAEDPEHPAAARGSGGPKLQKELVRIADACVAQGLLSRATQCGDWEQVQRLRELSSPDCSHEWLWAISAHEG
jgi:hypothetical protein